MSLNRFIYYCAVGGGWAALLAWMCAEWLFFRRHAWYETAPGVVRDTLTAALVGGVLGGGLGLVSGMTSAQWHALIRRGGLGFLGGLLGGGFGGLVGTVLYWLYFPRAIGWLVMGAGIGVAEGLYERSWRKTRNGLIGGALGGFLGGWLFEWIAAARSEMSGRATAFVVLGLSVGVLIGLAHVVLKEAWLTVLDGYRPGRQLILSKDVTTLGRAEHLPLPFLGHADAELELEHARIVRQPDGRYLLEDRGTRVGTLLNSQRIQGAVPLCDNDLIKLGTNIVRFNHRRRTRSHHQASPAAPPMAKRWAISPPPPPPIALGRLPEPTDLATPPKPAIGGGKDESQGVSSPPRKPEISVHPPGVGPIRPPPPPPNA
jgi:hypothetical protein